MEKNKIKLIRTNSANKHFKELTSALDEELWGNYGEQQAVYHEHNQVEELDTVLLAYIDDKAVACGCFRPFTDNKAAELKRMFVKMDYRGHGISRLILNELESWVKEKGFRSTLLETGVLQTEAIGLYKKSGYQQIENYGDYKGLDDSICFSKQLVVSSSNFRIQ